MTVKTISMKGFIIVEETALKPVPFTFGKLLRTVKTRKSVPFEFRNITEENAKKLERILKVKIQ